MKYLTKNRILQITSKQKTQESNDLQTKKNRSKTLQPSINCNAQEIISAHILDFGWSAEISEKFSELKKTILLKIDFLKREMLKNKYLFFMNNLKIGCNLDAYFQTNLKVR